MQFRSILYLILVVTLVGCVTPSPYRCVPPVNRLQICTDIRRQLIFFSNDPIQCPTQYTATWDSPIRKALLLRKYRQYRCDEVLRECAPAAVIQCRHTQAG